jgi:hypothetical protein
MIKLAVAASAFFVVATPVSANTAPTTTESVRQAVCVKVTIKNPDGSGESTEKCTISSSGAQ